jgi:hypothetical protein
MSGIISQLHMDITHTHTYTNLHALRHTCVFFPCYVCAQMSDIISELHTDHTPHTHTDTNLYTVGCTYVFFPCYVCAQMSNNVARLYTNHTHTHRHKSAYLALCIRIHSIRCLCTYACLSTRIHTHTHTRTDVSGEYTMMKAAVVKGWHMPVYQHEFTHTHILIQMCLVSTP